MATELVGVIAGAVRETHSWFAATVGDVTQERLHDRPPGTANPMAAVYAHVVVGSDFTLHSVLQSRPPLIANWPERAGVSDLSAAPDWHDWATSVVVAQFGPYAQAVYVAWSTYLDSLSDADLARVFDVPRMGERTLAQMLTMQVQHFSAHCGEIACLKGLTGATGYRPGTPDGIG